jgi:hypothetical protein
VFEALSVIMEFDIGRVCEAVESHLGDLNKCGVTIQFKDPDRSATYNVDGDRCISSISFWPNGLCDSEHIIVATEQRSFNHYEFATEELAILTIIRELEAAIQRA